MTRQSLGRINDYKCRLLLYAKHRGIKVLFRSDIVNGAYYPSIPAILICDDFEDTEELAILLHELGHSTDVNLLDTNNNRATKAYGDFYEHKATKNQMRFVLRTELRAWMVGRQIASSLEIPLGSWYSDYMFTGINGYKEYK